MVLSVVLAMQALPDFAGSAGAAVAARPIISQAEEVS